MEGVTDDDDEQRHVNPKRMRTTLNPLLLDLVVENVLTRLSSDLRRLLDLRLVCKAWETEATKVVRRVSQTDMNVIVTPYPDGLGWADTYVTPYPVIPIENVRLNGTCGACSSDTVIKWFKTLGSNVKQLEFSSSVQCYHQIRFLECVFKKWCPNLTSIKFKRVSCFTTLNHLSRFNTKRFVCDIRNVTVSTTLDTIAAQDCTALEPTFLDSSSVYAFDFINFETDGGIVGQVFKHCSVQKIVLEDFVAEHSDALILSLYRFDTATMKSLNHFEYSSCLFMWGWQLDNFRKIQFPLTHLCFGSLTNRLTTSDMHVLISSFSDTLQVLEFNGSVKVLDWENDDEPEYIAVSIPRLEKLRVFKNSNVFCTRVGGLDFMLNLPSLESCELSCPTSGSSVYPLTPSQVFNLLFQSASFGSPHQLKCLTLHGKIAYERYFSLISEWFPNLTTIELTLDGTDVFVEFLSHMKDFKLQRVKLFLFVNDHAWANSAIQSFLPLFSDLKTLELIQMSDSPLKLTESTFQNGFARVPSLAYLTLENVALNDDELSEVKRSVAHIPEVKLTQLVLQAKPVNMHVLNGSSIQH